MKSVALVLCLALSLPLSAARRRTAAPPAAALSIEFVDGWVDGATFVASGSDAWVELNTVSRQAGSMGKPLRIQRPFGIRILRAGGVSWGTAKVTARLDSPDGRSSLRIDGQILGRTPLIVSTHAVVGATTMHLLEIEVGGSVAAGPLAASISWDVTTQ
ncbi:MAG: hypothetical protein JWN02_636 [Acidobacteria bacterium]|jgi:hypothetical protein|nr:hypothetical protein [Acidobacteriota bacterium]